MNTRVDPEGVGVLGVASRCPEERLAVAFVSVQVATRAVTIHDAWRGRTGTAPKQQLADLVTTAQTRLEQAHATAVAVKRAESTVRKPTAPYDDRTRLEGAVMVAAPADVPYYAYRTQELKARLGENPYEIAPSLCGAAGITEFEAEALAAACAALRDLGHELGADRS